MKPKARFVCLTYIHNPAITLRKHTHRTLTLQDTSCSCRWVWPCTSKSIIRSRYNKRSRACTYLPRLHPTSQELRGDELTLQDRLHKSCHTLARLMFLCDYRKLEQHAQNRHLARRDQTLLACLLTTKGHIFKGTVIYK